MPSRHRSRPLERIESLMERASDAMARTSWFEAERIAQDALALARRSSDFLAMSRICLPLQEARRNRLSAAFDAAETSGVRIHFGPAADDAAPLPGCWLVTPPQVGADARRLRLAALAREIPVAVLCREPTTRAGRWPVVAVGRVVVRVHLEPPPGAVGAPIDTAPPLPWFIAALEALGDAAIASAGQERDPLRRADALLDRLDAHPDHEKLHQALAGACRDAHDHARNPGRTERRDPAPAADGDDVDLDDGSA